MRIIEILIVLVCVAFLLGNANQPMTPRWALLFAVLLAGLLALQLLFEGWRLPFAPVYVVAIAILCTAPLALRAPATTALFASVLGLGLIGIGVLVCLLLPFLALPPPTGDYALGSTMLTLPASTGPEPVVQIWYPIARTPPTQTLADLLERRREHGWHATPDLDTRRGAPLPAGEKFPVLLYFPGWPGTGLSNLLLIRDLASHGFVVATVIYPSNSNRPMQDYASDATMQRSVAANNERAKRNAEDGMRILDLLARLDAQNPGGAQNPSDAQIRAGVLAGHLDLAHTGVVGYSFGGAVAAELSRLDARIGAAVNIDGRHWASALEHGVQKPYLFIGEPLLMPDAAALASKDPATRYEAALDQVDYRNLAVHLRENGGIQASIAGTTHANFSDGSLSSHWRRLSGGGPIDALRAHRILDAYVLAFFEQTLRGQPSSLLAGPSPEYPEVRLDRYGAGT